MMVLGRDVPGVGMQLDRMLVVLMVTVMMVLCEAMVRVGGSQSSQATASGLSALLVRKVFNKDFLTHG